MCRYFYHIAGSPQHVPRYFILLWLAPACGGVFILLLTLPSMCRYFIVLLARPTMCRYSCTTGSPHHVQVFLSYCWLAPACAGILVLLARPNMCRYFLIGKNLTFSTQFKYNRSSVIIIIFINDVQVYTVCAYNGQSVIECEG